MIQSQKTVKQAWMWAIAINVVIFAILWIVLARMPLSSRAVVQEPDTPSEQDPGDTFGHMDRLIGSESVAEDEGIQVPDEIEVETGDEAAVPVETEIPVEIDVPVENVIPEVRDQWIDEFYLSADPALSFAPRLNEDGTPRSHPTDLPWFKGPEYGDAGGAIDVANLNVPPAISWSKDDLPDEMSDHNYELSVRIVLDTRGRLTSEPMIVRSSQSHEVDRITIDRIVDEQTFAPVTRKDTGQPVAVTLNLPVFWN